MADKEKIKAEIERLKAIADYQLDNCKVDKSAWRQQAEVCKKILSFINSMGEDRPEPISPADVGFEALGKVWDEEARKDSDELTHSVTKLSDQDEPAIENLEAEIHNKIMMLHTAPCYDELADFARHFASWQKKIDNRYANLGLVEQIRLQQKCYEKGMADMKQQMMKNVTYGEVSQCTTYPYNLKIQSIKTIDKDLKVGDKVKLIIIKEE